MAHLQSIRGCKSCFKLRHSGRRKLQRVLQLRKRTCRDVVTTFVCCRFLLQVVQSFVPNGSAVSLRTCAFAPRANSDSVFKALGPILRSHKVTFSTQPRKNYYCNGFGVDRVSIVDLPAGHPCLCRQRAEHCIRFCIYRRPVGCILETKPKPVNEQLQVAKYNSHDLAGGTE